MTTEDISAFIGRNAAAYLSVWSRMAASGNYVTSWSWPGFLVPLPWMMYRKMFGIAAILFLLPIVISVIFPSWSGSLTGVAVALAMVSKSMYVRHAESKIKKILKRTEPGPERALQLQRAGGTSIPGAVIGSVLYALSIAAALLSVAAHKLPAS